MRVDPRPSYKTGLGYAQKQNAHAQIGRNPNVGRNVAHELLDLTPEDAEVHLMLADAILHDARQPSLSSIEAEDLYSQAHLALQNAQFQYDREPERYRDVKQLAKKIQKSIKRFRNRHRSRADTGTNRRSVDTSTAIQEFTKRAP